MKIKISGLSDPDRNVWLTLPASEEQVRQAFEKLTEGLPIGKTFPYHITSTECGYVQVAEYIRENSSVREVNLLSYLMENIKQELRETALWIAGRKAEPSNLSSFINELAAVKSGWYEIKGEGKDEIRAVSNHDSKPDIYRQQLLGDWLDAERETYEQRQTETLAETLQIEPEMTME